MAELAVDLPIFVASPADVAAERTIAEDEIVDLGGTAARNGLLVSPILWETSALPGVGKPQDRINPLLARAELVLVILSRRLGSGTEEELLRATQQVFRGASDDVFIYFRDGESDLAHSGRVEELRRQLDANKQYFFWSYADEQSFRETLRDHLQRWLERWQRVPPICRATLQHSAPGAVPDAETGENRLLFIRNAFRYDRHPEATATLGRIAVTMYQERGNAALDTPLRLERRACHRSSSA